MKTIITFAHLAALSMIESGNHDAAVGKAGEVTRYQICPTEWRQAWAVLGKPSMAERHTQDEGSARIIAFGIWDCRVQKFMAEQHRDPSVTELYLLWHRPARVLHPHPVEVDRAHRFANLVELYTKHPEELAAVNRKAYESWANSGFSSATLSGREHTKD